MTNHKQDPSDREFLLTLDLWPNWPIQPVKKRNPKGGFPDVGIIFEGGGFTVYDVNLFALPTGVPLAEWPVHGTFGTVDELLATGWVVD